jgi:hypothetical protein
MLNFDEINDILNDMAQAGIVEPMVEPIDEQDCHPMDYADVTGLFDEMYPEPEMMVDENGEVWYVG